MNSLIKNIKFFMCFYMFFCTNLYPKDKIERPFKTNIGYFVYMNFQIGPQKGGMMHSLKIEYEGDKVNFYIDKKKGVKIIGKFEKGNFLGELKTKNGDLIFKGSIELEKDTKKKIIKGVITGKNINGHEIKGLFKIK